MRLRWLSVVVVGGFDGWMDSFFFLSPLPFLVGWLTTGCE